VNWDVRRALLLEIAVASVADLQENWRDGREKLFVTRRLLEWRRFHSDLFAEGDYQPLQVEGTRGNHLCAFARRLGNEGLVVAVPRLVWGLYRGGATADWEAAELALPSGAAWQDLFTGRRLSGWNRVPVSDLLEDFSVCVLYGEFIDETAQANTEDCRGWLEAADTSGTNPFAEIDAPTRSRESPGSA
jgi:(1->4)-alpha-D-glucan 1-alpha-D-glucosylmutase